MPEHTGKPQATSGYHSVRVVVSAMKIRVRHNSLASHVVKGDILSGQFTSSRDYQCMTHPLRKIQRPLQRLHPTKASACYGSELFNSKIVRQSHMCFDPVFNSHDGKIRTVAFASSRIYAGGSGR